MAYDLGAVLNMAHKSRGQWINTVSLGDGALKGENRRIAKRIIEHYDALISRISDEMTPKPIDEQPVVTTE